MNTQEVIILCTISAALVIATGYQIRNAHPVRRALAAFVFGMPLWVYIVFPILKATK